MFENRDEAVKYIERKGYLVINEYQRNNIGVFEIYDRNMNRGEVLYKGSKSWTNIRKYF